jgi:integrase
MTTTNDDDAPRLRQLRSGIWVLARSERCADGKIRTHTESTGTRDRAEAEHFLREVAAQTAVRAANGAVTVNDLIAGYEQDAQDRGASASTFIALRPIKALLGAYRPDQLTRDVLRDYRASRGNTQGPTHRRELAGLLAVFNWAVRHRLMPQASVPYIELPANSLPREVFLDENDEARLWALAAGDEDRHGRLSKVGLFVCLALGTGARAGAIMQLTWDRVDFKTGMVDYRVPGQKMTKKRKVKTVMNSRLLPVLTRARAEAPFARKVIHSNVRRRLEGFLTAHGFGHVTPHVFRHTFVTLSLRAGMSIWDVAGLAGMSPNVLQTVYGHHVADARLRDAANRRFA